MRLCPKCRGERSECGDHAKVWHMWREVCHKAIALEAARRIHAEEYKGGEWHDGTFTTFAKEFSPETPNHYLDGVTLWVQDTPQPKRVTP